MILGLVITPADVSDREAAQSLIQTVVDEQERLAKLWADQNYSGDFGGLGERLRGF